MPVADAFELGSDGSLGEYGQRLRISIAARATILKTERRRFHEDLDALRSRASDHRR